MKLTRKVTNTNIQDEAPDSNAADVSSDYDTPSSWFIFPQSPHSRDGTNTQWRLVGPGRQFVAAEDDQIEVFSALRWLFGFDSQRHPLRQRLVHRVKALSNAPLRGNRKYFCLQKSSLVTDPSQDYILPGRNSKT